MEYIAPVGAERVHGMNSYSNYMDLKIWSIPEVCLPAGSTARETAQIICASAAQEGLILHGGDVIGLSKQFTSTGDRFVEQLQQVLQQCAGVRPHIVFFDPDQQNPESSIAALCSMVVQHTRRCCHAVVIQGAVL